MDDSMQTEVPTAVEPLNKEVHAAPPLPREILRLSKPLEGLDALITGRTDFFAELAQVVALEVQRLLRYTMLTHAQPRSLEAEQRAESDVQNALTDILSHFAEYVDTALQIVTNVAGTEPMAPDVEASVLAKQLDESIAHNQELLRRQTSQEDRIKRLNAMLKSMRVQYYKDVEGQRDRFRCIIGRYLPDLPSAELQDVLGELSTVQIFDANAFLDEDTKAAVQHRVEALTAEFAVEREALLSQIQVVTEMEAEAKHKLKVALKRGERLTASLNELSKKPGSAAASFKSDADDDFASFSMQEPRMSTATISPISTQGLSSAPGAGASPSRNDYKLMMDKVKAVEGARKVVFAEVNFTADLLAKQQHWLENLAKPSLQQEIGILKLMTADSLRKCEQMKKTLEADAPQTADEKYDFDEEFARESHANEIRVLHATQEMQRIEIEKLKPEIEDSKGKVAELEGQVEQLTADLEFKDRELASERSKVEGLQVVESHKTETLKHANTTLKVLKMLKWGKTGRRLAEEEAGAEPDEIKSLNPESIDEKINELVQDEARRFTVEYDAMKRKVEKQEEQIAKVAEEKQELELQTKRLTAKVEEERLRADTASASSSATSWFPAPGENASADESGNHSRNHSRAPSKEPTTDHHRSGMGSRRSSKSGGKKKSKHDQEKHVVNHKHEKQGQHDKTEKIDEVDEASPRKVNIVEPSVVQVAYGLEASAVDLYTQDIGIQTHQNRKREQEVSVRPQIAEKECQVGVPKGRRKAGPHDCGAALEWNLIVAQEQKGTRGLEYAMNEAHASEMRELKEEIFRLRHELRIKKALTPTSPQQDSSSSTVSPTKEEIDVGHVFSRSSVLEPGSNVSGPSVVCEMCHTKVDPSEAYIKGAIGWRNRNGSRGSRRASLHQARSVVLNGSVDNTNLFAIDDLDVELAAEPDKANLEEIAESESMQKAATTRSNKAEAENDATLALLVRKKVKNELRVEYAARLNTMVADERARLYRAWPRVASADPVVVPSKYRRTESRKSVDVETLDARVQVLASRNEALRRIDDARMLMYSRANVMADSAGDARVGELREVLESGAMFSHYECIGTLTRRLMATRGEFIRLRHRLAGALFECDRLQVELNLERTNFISQRSDFAILWRRQASWLLKCANLLDQTGTHVTIPRALLRRDFDATTVQKVIQSELASEGRGVGEAGKAEVERKLTKCRQRASYSVLADSRARMLQNQLKAFQFADALFVFHKIHEEEPGVKPKDIMNLSDVRSLINDQAGLPKAVEQLRRRLRLAVHREDYFESKAHFILDIMDQIEFREQQVNEQHHDHIKLELGDEPPRRQFEDTIDVAVNANKYLDDAQYELSEAAVEEARTVDLDGSDDEVEDQDWDVMLRMTTEGTEDTGRNSALSSRAVSRQRTSIADTVAASIRRVETDQLSSRRQSDVLGVAKKMKLKESVKSNFKQRPKTNAQRLKALVDMAKAKQALAESCRVIKEIDAAMNYSGTPKEANLRLRQRRAEEAAASLEKMDPARAAELVMKLATEQRTMVMEAMSVQFRYLLLAALPAVIARMPTLKKKFLQRNYEAMTGKTMPETEEEADALVAQAMENLKAEGKVDEIPESWGNAIRLPQYQDARSASRASAVSAAVRLPQSQDARSASRASAVSAAGGDLDDPEDELDPMAAALELGLWGIDDDDDDDDSNVEQGGGLNILTDVIGFATELLDSMEEAASHAHDGDGRRSDEDTQENGEQILALRTPNLVPGDSDDAEKHVGRAKGSRTKARKKSVEERSLAGAQKKSKDDASPLRTRRKSEDETAKRAASKSSKRETLENDEAGKSASRKSRRDSEDLGEASITLEVPQARKNASHRDKTTQTDFDRRRRPSHSSSGPQTHSKSHKSSRKFKIDISSEEELSEDEQHRRPPSKAKQRRKNKKGRTDESDDEVSQEKPQRNGTKTPKQRRPSKSQTMDTDMRLDADTSDAASALDGSASSTKSQKAKQRKRNLATEDGLNNLEAVMAEEPSMDTCTSAKTGRRQASKAYSDAKPREPDTSEPVGGRPKREEVDPEGEEEDSAESEAEQNMPRDTKHRRKKNKIEEVDSHDSDEPAEPKQRRRKPRVDEAESDDDMESRVRRRKPQTEESESDAEPEGPRRRRRTPKVEDSESDDEPEQPKQRRRKPKAELEESEEVSDESSQTRKTPSGRKKREGNQTGAAGGSPSPKKAKRPSMMQQKSDLEIDPNVLNRIKQSMSRTSTEGESDQQRLTVQELADQCRQLSVQEKTQLMDLVPLRNRTTPKALQKQASMKVLVPKDDEAENPRTRQSLSALLGEEASKEAGIEIQDAQLTVSLDTHQCSHCNIMGKMSVYCVSCGTTGSTCSQCGELQEVGALSPSTNLWVCKACWIQSTEEGSDGPFKIGDIPVTPYVSYGQHEHGTSSPNTDGTIDLNDLSSSRGVVPQRMMTYSYPGPFRGTESNASLKSVDSTKVMEAPRRMEPSRCVSPRQGVMAMQAARRLRSPSPSGCTAAPRSINSLLNIPPEIPVNHELEAPRAHADSDCAAKAALGGAAPPRRTGSSPGKAKDAPSNTMASLTKTGDFPSESWDASSKSRDAPSNNTDNLSMDRESPKSVEVSHEDVDPTPHRTVLAPSSHARAMKHEWDQVFGTLQRTGKKVEAGELARQLREVRKNIRHLYKKYTDALYSEETLYHQGYAEALEAYKAHENAMGRAVYSDKLARLAAHELDDLPDSAHWHHDHDHEEDDHYSHHHGLQQAQYAPHQNPTWNQKHKTPHAAALHFKAAEHRRHSTSWIISGDGAQAAVASRASMSKPKRWTKKDSMAKPSGGTLSGSDSDSEVKRLASIVMGGDVDQFALKEGQVSASPAITKHPVERMVNGFEKVLHRVMASYFGKLHMATVLPVAQSSEYVDQKGVRGSVRHQSDKRLTLRGTPGKRTTYIPEPPKPASEQYVGAISWSYKKPDSQPAAEPEPESPVIKPLPPKEPWTQQRAESLIRALVDPRETMMDSMSTSIVGQRSYRPGRIGFKPETRSVVNAVGAKTEDTCKPASFPAEVPSDEADSKMQTMPAHGANTASNWMKLGSQTELAGEGKLPQIDASSPKKGLHKNDGLRTPRMQGAKLGGTG